MAYVQSASSGASALFGPPYVADPFTLTFSANCSNGNSIVVDVGWKVAPASSGSIQVVDSAGNTYSQAFSTGMGSHVGECWYSSNIVAGIGANTIYVVYTGSGGIEDLVLAIHEYSNLLHVSPLDTHGAANATSPATVTATLTTGYDIELLHAFAITLGAHGLSLVPGQPVNFQAREAGGSAGGLIVTYDAQISLEHPVDQIVTIQPGVSITHWAFGAAIIAFKVPVSPTAPGFSWLIINEPELGYTDQSTYLHFGSEQSFSQILRQRGTARVTMRVAAADTYTPTIGSQVFLFDQNIAGHTLVFAGTIDTIELTWLGSLGDRLFALGVISFEAAFDALLVPPQTFFYQTAEDIFSQLLTTIAGGVPVAPGTITAPFVINTLSTDWSRLSEIFNQLAAAATCTWGVDLATLTVYLKPISATAAPFTLQSNQVLWGSNRWSQNKQDYRNRQIIRISIDAFAQSAELFAFGGVPQTFALSYPAQEVTGAWFTYNTQNSATGSLTGIPTNGDTVTIGYPQSGSIYNWAPNAPYYTGQIIIDSLNHIQACTQGNSPGSAPTSLSGSTQPTWDDTGGTTSDGAIVWTDKGLSGAGGIGASVYTFVDGIDNTQWGQVLIGTTQEECSFNLHSAINADQNQVYVGQVFSWPTWENPVVNSEYGGASFTVKNKSAGAGYVAALDTSSSAFSWSAAATGGGSTALGTVSLQVSAQGSSNSANIYYTPGSVTVSLASRPSGAPSSGGSIQIQYKRAASDCIVVEDTQEVYRRSAVENGTGKYQQIVSDTSNTSNTSGLQKAQAALAAFKQIPISFSFRAFKPGLAPGQLLAISFTGDPAGIDKLVNGSYVVQEIAGSLVPVYRHMDPAVEDGGHYEYTVTVINVSQIFDYLDFWQQMGSGGGGGGSITAGAAPALLADHANAGGEFSIPAVDISTTLSAAITSTTATTATLTSAAGLPDGPFLFTVGTECIYALSGSSTSLTGLVRGYNDTTAATHLISAAVHVTTFTPDLTQGIMQLVALSKHSTLLAPVSGPVSFQLDIQQDATGGRALLPSTGYVGVDGTKFDQTPLYSYILPLAIRATGNVTIAGPGVSFPY